MGFNKILYLQFLLNFTNQTTFWSK